MKKMIISQLATIMAAVVIITLAINFMVEVWNCEANSVRKGSDLLWQVEQIINQNNEELKTVVEEHRRQCIKSAKSAAYILSNMPEVMTDPDELKKISTLLSVDEIHIIDDNGEIINGTEPKYYGYTFNSGEQISFFLPMLTDKTLTMCQDITPNTAENKMMQYAATWNEDGTMIVQIGIEPIHVLDVTEKNELSYIFSLLTTDEGCELYAINYDNGNVLGSTNSNHVGQNITELGLDITTINTDKEGFHTTLNDTSSYCVFTIHNNILLGYIIPCSILYDSITDHTLVIGIYFIFITSVMTLVITTYLSKNIVHGIADINNKLTEITKGNFETVVDINTTPEFTELSNYINSMVTSIINTTDKISYILDKASLPIGVYEYSENLTVVRATHQISEILSLNDEQAETLLADHNTFEAYLEQLRNYALEADPTIYKLPMDEERYIKMESFQKEDAIMGFIMDVTSDVIKRQHIENERDVDLLTQLYNRRALEHKLDKLFKHPELIKHAAMIMLDSDGLKNINDRYGHKVGDKYLCETADLLRTINAPKHIIARQGGDEFVLFLYACESHAELMEYIHLLSNLREESFFEVDESTRLPITYSFGYAVYKRDGDDYITLLREADMRMYSEKRHRKAHHTTS